MAFNGRYTQANTGSETHFSQGVMGETEFSRMSSVCTHVTTFNAGDIVPIYYAEVLPHDTFSINIDSIIRQSTLLTPTMGQMVVDFYAFFVPNRVVNTSAPFVFGENPNSSWTASPVSFAPLVSPSATEENIQIPVGSVADYYGFPTQRPIPTSVLKQCNDLKFRGYIEIYNEFFRDQNYQPPIPYSKLNIYEGFMVPKQASGDRYFSVDGVTPPRNMPLPADTVPDGDFGSGAVAQAIYGNLKPSANSTISAIIRNASSFDALSAPLKANKMHDYFTSGLPTPQKGPEVFIPASGVLSSVPVYATSTNNPITVDTPSLRLGVTTGSGLTVGQNVLIKNGQGDLGVGVQSATSTVGDFDLTPLNLATAGDSEVTGINVSINDLRMASAIQKVYESLGRGGSRYREYVKSFFGIEVDDPFKDIPTYLGHVRRDLNLYQTAQTSASETGNTPQGNLAAFGYTEANGQLFAPFTAMENGYIHIMCVVRHKNIYSSYLAPDNFRMNMMDFYQPQLANISEQPVYTKYINPFVSDPTQVFCYQEAWAEYRFDPDRVSGYMRPGIDGSLSVWNYADEFSSDLTVMDAEFVKSNSQAVLDRTLAVTSDVAPQLKGQFVFKIDKQRPMPVYSVPGMDII